MNRWIRTLKNYPAEMAWAVIQAKNQAFAVATRDLREMVIMPEVSEVPNTGEHVRGVINLRGRVLPLIDLRKRIGLASLAEENAAFLAMLWQREKDHHNWLRELEASVRERREFQLTTDPAQVRVREVVRHIRAGEHAGCDATEEVRSAAPADSRSRGRSREPYESRTGRSSAGVD